jgi:glutamyl-tRNA synthetase
MVQALGYRMPAYAHLPYVAEPGSKRKLSKRKLEAYLKNPDFAQVHRHGTEIAAALGLATTPETFNPVTVDFYEQVGYLPAAIVNYLVLLGWSLDDRTEFLTREQMVESFSLARVNPAPASFDAVKLGAFQLHYMQGLSVEQKTAGVLPFLAKMGWISRPASDDEIARIARIIQALGDRLKVFGDIVLQAPFFFGAEVVALDEKAFAKRLLAEGATERLAAYRTWLATVRDPFDAGSLQQGTHEFLESRGWVMGDIVHAVRVAVTGSAVGPGLFDTLEILGRDRCLRRIDQALRKAGARDTQEMEDLET